MSEPLYREELDVLRYLVVAEIRRQDPNNFNVMVALGSLHRKIAEQLKTAVSLPIPDLGKVSS